MKTNKIDSAIATTLILFALSTATFGVADPAGQKSKADPPKNAAKTRPDGQWNAESKTVAMGFVVADGGQTVKDIQVFASVGLGQGTTVRVPGEHKIDEKGQFDVNLDAGLVGSISGKFADDGTASGDINLRRTFDQAISVGKWDSKPGRFGINLDLIFGPPKPKQGFWIDAKAAEQSDKNIRVGAARTRGSRVTGNKMWVCPKCGTTLGKGNLGKVWNPGDPIETVGGRATCGGCQAVYQQADVYGGMYDVEEKATKQDKPGDIEGKVSLVTFRNFSTTPPQNPTEISSAILKNRYPKAVLGKNYVIGLTDSITTADEAVAQYKANVKEKTLPDLGSQFDVWTGTDITGKQVTSLFFK